MAAQPQTQSDSRSKESEDRLAPQAQLLKQLELILKLSKWSFRYHSRRSLTVYKPAIREAWHNGHRSVVIELAPSVALRVSPYLVLIGMIDANEVNSVGLTQGLTFDSRYKDFMMKDIVDTAVGAGSLRHWSLQ